MAYQVCPACGRRTQGTDSEGHWVCVPCQQAVRREASRASVPLPDPPQVGES